MAHFKASTDYKQFSMLRTHTNRYIQDSHSAKFLPAVLDTAKARIIDLPKGTVLWRAQLGEADPRPYEWEEGFAMDYSSQPHPPERMKPRRDMVTESRANPKGIPYLYLATDRDTAMAEVRPWLDADISVAEFHTMRDLKLIDCSVHDNEAFHQLGKTDPVAIERIVWADIDIAFSNPVTESDYSVGYVPTQIIAELFKLSETPRSKLRGILGLLKHA